MISPDEFQKRITQPPKKERERVRERLVKTYEEALVELQQHVDLIGAVPSAQHLRECIDLAWSDHPHNERAKKEAIGLYAAAEAASRKFKMLSHLKESSSGAAAGARSGKYGDIHTTGDALKAMARAYRAADATMSMMFSTAVEAMGTVAKMKPKVPERILSSRRKPAPWGRFSVRLPYPPENLTPEIRRRLRVLQRYPAVLEQRMVPAMFHEATAIKKTAKASGDTVNTVADNGQTGGGVS
jgi:hypothetical protein